MSRKRRTFTSDFKREAARLAVADGASVAQVAENLDVGESVLRRWMAHMRSMKGAGHKGASRPMSATRCASCGDAFAIWKWSGTS